MNISFKSVTAITVLSIAVSATIIGCTQIYEITYPQNFTYMDNKEVESLMQRMGEHIGKLNRLVADAPPSDTERRDKIVAELDKLERIAIRLSGEHTQTNQFHISDHIEEFISDIGTAKMFARANPPNYYKIDNVTNGCANCHQFR